MTDPVAMLLKQSGSTDNLLQLDAESGSENLLGNESSGDDFANVLQDEVSAQGNSAPEQHQNTSHQSRDEGNESSQDDDFINTVSDKVSADTNKAMTEGRVFNQIIESTTKMNTQLMQNEGENAAELSIEEGADALLEQQSVLDRTALLQQARVKPVNEQILARPLVTEDDDLPIGRLALAADDQAEPEIELTSKLTINDKQQTNNNQQNIGNGKQSQDVLQALLSISEEGTQKSGKREGRDFSQMIGTNYQMKPELTMNTNGINTTITTQRADGSVDFQNTSHLTSVKVPVGQNNWAESVFDRVAWLTGQNNKSAQIQLNPPELGPLEVKVKINNDQAHVQFSTSHGAVKEALETAETKLREMLESHGLSLANMNVADGTAEQQQAEGDENEDGPGSDSLASTEDDLDGADLISSIEEGLGLSQRGLVDMYV